LPPTDSNSTRYFAPPVLSKEVAMSNPTPIDTKENETVEAAQEWLHQNGTNIAGIEQKLNEKYSEGFPARTMIIKRKAKRKDDGPLEIFCRWVVDNQIGRGKSLLNTPTLY
jgi:very-long-chain ceramide synthase